jgi:hypothetical protein
MNELVCDRGTSLVERYNRSTFAFPHRLHELPLFDVERLTDLALRLPSVYYEYGAGNVDDGWRAQTDDRPTLRETMETIAHSDSLLLMKGLAGDPEFGPLFRDIVDELLERVGPALRDDVSEARATLIVSSPHRVTPYHIDGETNFLFQVRGTKQLTVFDQSDPGVITEAELERFYAGDLSAARYRPDRQGDATTYVFAPGDAVHIPLHAPHWARNGADVSVAISVNVSLESTKRLAQVYRFNHLMRKGGLTPAPPGAAPWRDRLKVVAGAGVEYARSRRRARRASSGR